MKATAKLQALGQSLWLDNITREMLDSGQLQRYIDQSSITGLTSNPSIFDKAIQSGAYDDCINTARRYVTLHPGSPDAAYAQFLIGASYFDQMPEISRDQDRTEKAMQALDEVVRKYPDSEYAVAAKRKIDVVTSAITDVPLAEQRARWSPTRRECAECGKADYEQERCLGVPLHRPDEN